MKPEIEKAIQNFYEHCKIHPLYKQTLLNREHVALWRTNSETPNTLFIGEAAGNEEAKKGKPFVGRSGQLLQKAINYAQIKHYAITNVMPIKPTWNNGKIRAPLQSEINFFKPYLKQLIKAVKPLRIILLGKTATTALEQKWKPLTWNGNIGILYHPAYYLRGNRNIYKDMELLLNRYYGGFK